MRSTQSRAAKSTDPAGKSTERDFTDGQATWSEALSHAIENIGTTEVHAVTVEIKGLSLKMEKSTVDETPKVKPKEDKKP
jgi:hypothetical protein